MKNLLKVVSIIALTIITQTAYSAAVDETFETGDTLTAEKINNIKSAVNDNDTRIDSISSCTVTKNADIASITCSSESGDESIASVSDGTTTTGNTPGDMQYWDGSEWVVVPAATANAKALSFCGGVPTWTFDGCYNIGERGPAGGFVFYVTDGGLHGLEAAPVDQTESAWGCVGDDVSDAVGTDIGTGVQNTEVIVSFGCSGGSPAAALAATVYELSGYDDWFLPSKDELNLMWTNLADSDGDSSNSGPADPNNVGGFASSAYWSSSQNGSNYAWFQHFAFDRLNVITKNRLLNVRAVRAF
jgi:hypothetical protein